MKKVGLLGGTFNPIHNGHLYIASEAMEKLNLQKIIFMPAGNPPHKRNKPILDANIRMEMVSLAIEDYKDFTTCDYEVNKQGYSYTYETLKYLKSVYEDIEIYFITGGDSLAEIFTWKNVNEILSLSHFVVFNRPGYTLEKLLSQKKRVEEIYNKEIIFLDLLQLDISSTDIRNRIKNNSQYKFFLPDRVYNFIEKLNLYR